MPDATLGDVLADSTVGPLARTMTIGELIGRESGRGAARTGTAKNGKSAARTDDRAKTGAHEVRTSSGREAYDAKVLAAIEAAKAPVSAEQVRKLAGGTPIQFRAAVERLMENKRVKRLGKARGTRYKTA